MKTSNNGIKLIKYFESCRLTAYKAVSTEKYYTIGYGHYGADVKAGMTITSDRAEELLKADLITYENKVNAYCSKYDFNQNEFDALVCFAYNVGNINQLTARGTRTKEDIRKHWLSYNKAGGKVLYGLTNRRMEELKLFNTPVTADIVETANADIDKVTNKLKELDKLVRDTIAGKYGSGYARRTALGNKYQYVQNVINFIYYT